ncbi:MAG: (2Fe-2S)-binding protein [Phycisphaerales bacterium]
MTPDDEICLCFHVPLRKIRAYLEREDPPVASLISECLGAGTGCGWCVPILRKLHAQHQGGKAVELGIDPSVYADQRKRFHHSGEREGTVTEEPGE